MTPKGQKGLLAGVTIPKRNLCTRHRSCSIFLLQNKKEERRRRGRWQGVYQHQHCLGEAERHMHSAWNPTSDKKEQCFYGFPKHSALLSRISPPPSWQQASCYTFSRLLFSTVNIITQVAVIITACFLLESHLSSIMGRSHATFHIISHTLFIQVGRIAVI